MKNNYSNLEKISEKKFNLFQKNSLEINKVFSINRSLNLLTIVIFLLLCSSNVWSQSAVSRIHTDWNGYWTSNSPTDVGNRPTTENNLLAFEWDGTTYSTAVNDATLISNGVEFNPQKFRALKIQSLNYNAGSTFFLQGSMIDGSMTERVLTPPLTLATSTPAELAARLTDGKNGLALGTGIANIATKSVFFKVGTNNLNFDGLGDGIPDLIVTQVAQTGGQNDVFKFVDRDGNQVGNEISVAFGQVPIMGTYSLDLFNAANGSIANFPIADNRPIRILVYDTSAFGITSENAALVDRFVVTFSGSSDCAFIAFNANSLKNAELSMVKSATIGGCGKLGDEITYKFDVTNSGDVPVTNVVVTDPLPGLVIRGDQGASLASGETITFTGSYTITEDDITAGRIINSATVTALDPSLNEVDDLSGLTISDGISTVTKFLSAPTSVNGDATICNGGSTTLTVAGGSVGAGATVEWFTDSCTGTSAGTGNSITVTPNANTTYFVRYKSNCDDEVTTCTSQLVKVNDLPSTPTVETITQPTVDVLTGSIMLSDLPTNGIVYQTGSEVKNYAITGTSMTISDLAPGTYNFSITNGTCSSASSTEDVLIEAALGTNDFDLKANTIIVFVKNKQININSFAESIGKVSVYDISGRVLYQKDNVNSNALILSNFRSSNQVLIVKTTLQSGKTSTNKIVN